MKRNFEAMMAWALGPQWRLMNIKKTPDIWKDIHPELPKLLNEESYCVWKQVVYWIFQMTHYWSAETGIRLKKTDESLDKPGLVNMVRAMWRDLKGFFCKK